MSLKQSLKEYILAAFAGLWVQTWEPDEAAREIAQLCSENHWRHTAWDLARGVQDAGDAGQGVGDPLFPLKTLQPARTDDHVLTQVLMLHNYHRFLNNFLAVQELINTVLRGKADRLFVVVLSPVVQIPVELEKLFVVVQHELPDADDLRTIAAEMTQEEVGAGEPFIAAAAGLTRYEAEGSYALSLARHNSLQSQEVWELKASALKKSGLLELHQGKETFADLGGLDALKAFCLKALAPGRNGRPPQGHGGPKPKGVLLLGVPGTGKSAFAKALGNETARPTLTLDVGSLYGSLVGQTEERIRQALKIADAMAPCVLFIDEIEKALSGVGSNGDSGVSTRLFGTLLTWLSDHTTEVFVIATCNDVSRLPPEFSRAERWDGVFFLDMPTEAQRADLWTMYKQKFDLPSNALVFADAADWTGAEVKSCCRLAALLGVTLQEAADHIVPIARTAADKVQALREWASGRCLDASRPGVYSRKPSPSNHAPRRRTLPPNKE